MSNASDFIIENGVLKEYVGPGGDVVIPEGVTKIGDRVFEYHVLSSIVIPEGVTHIGSSAFIGSNFRALVLPESLEEIGPHAFAGCMVLSELVIPENVKKIGSKAFNWCLSLDKITCGNNLTKVGSNAFKDTKWFLEKIGKSVCLENVLVSIDCADSRFIVPSNVTLIADSAFESCKGLCEIIVPETVQYIGAKAFARCCDLTRVNVCGTPEFEKDCIPEGAMVTALSCSIDAIKFKNLKLQMALGFFLEENNDAPIPDSIVQFISKNFDKAIPHLLKTPGLLPAIAKRKLAYDKYVEMLSNVPGIKLIAPQAGVTLNYAYMPVFFDGYKYTRQEVQDRLQEHNVWARKYFYPIIPELACYQEKYGDLEFPVSKHAAETVLALPMYADLSVEDVEKICKIILE